MNLIKANAAITMSSREIAELTGKEHFNVIRDIRTVLEVLGKDAISFEGIYQDSRNRTQTEYLLPRREVEILLTGYSIPLRAKVIDRLHELEAAVPQRAIPTSFAEALRLAASLEEENQALEASNARLLPHAQVGMAAGQRKRLGVVEFARKLPGVNTQQVQKDLQAMQYLHKRQGHWAVYSKFKGVLFDEVLDNEGRSKVVALEKGQQLLVKQYHEGRLTMKAGCTPARHLEEVA
ncbi:Rha family transcriptional regulator [Stutzerimonas nitrititolerans]|uniref:Rha family transcriptional regulator n=1 Tax=Stutzerimonas nitrititolerans TaxID=2482751 RepID=UPI00289FB069|nr:Rha family transcriptional regulator [Stutzerimonas nitrititolerans]